MSASSTPITISTLRFLKPSTLASALRDSTTASSTAIIDVRDNDHIGGHIKGSQWVPINQLDARMPELLRINKDKKRVVFHCMLSQQRGPSAALAYARAKQAAVEKELGETAEAEGAEVVRVDVEDEEKQRRAGWRDESVVRAGKVDGQEVCVLEGGFENWQALYGLDKTLTEGYVEDLW